MICTKSYNQGRQDLENEILNAKPSSAKIEDVKKEISQFYNMAWEVITQKRREREDYLLARQVFCYICKTLAIASDKIISQEAKYTDRTIARSSQKAIQNLMDTQPEIKNQILHILNRLK